MTARHQAGLVHLLLVAAIGGPFGCTTGKQNDSSATEADAGVDAGVCHFQSGRPCPVGGLCWTGTPDQSCYLATCDPELGLYVEDCWPCVDGGTADAGNAPAGAPFDCEPAHLVPPWMYSVCCLGWRTVHAAELPQTECVRLEFCKPIPCDPAYSDSCPWDWVCDESARTCRAP